MDSTSLPAPKDEDTHTIGRKSGSRPRIELITRGERRRIWTPEQKREIVEESLQPGTTPRAVARKHAISGGLVYTWRQQVLGLQGGPVVRSSPSFAWVEVTSVSVPVDSPDRMPPEPTTSSASSAVFEARLARFSPFSSLPANGLFFLNNAMGACSVRHNWCVCLSLPTRASPRRRNAAQGQRRLATKVNESGSQGLSGQRCRPSAPFASTLNIGQVIASCSRSRSIASPASIKLVMSSPSGCIQL